MVGLDSDLRFIFYCLTNIICTTEILYTTYPYITCTYIFHYYCSMRQTFQPPYPILDAWSTPLESKITQNLKYFQMRLSKIYFRLCIDIVSVCWQKFDTQMPVLFRSEMPRSGPEIMCFLLLGQFVFLAHLTTFRKGSLGTQLSSIHWLLYIHAIFW